MRCEGPFLIKSHGYYRPAIPSRVRPNRWCSAATGGPSDPPRPVPTADRPPIWPRPPRPTAPRADRSACLARPGRSSAAGGAVGRPPGAQGAVYGHKVAGMDAGPIIEPTLTRARKVENGLRNRSRVRSNGALSESSADEGKSAGTGQLNNGNSRVLKGGAAIKSPRDASIAIFKKFGNNIPYPLLLKKLVNCFLYYAHYTTIIH